MKYLAANIISFYQIILSPFLHAFFGFQNACRFNPTCSEYSKKMIMELGIIKGTQKSIERLFKCQPYGKYI